MNYPASRSFASGYNSPWEVDLRPGCEIYVMA